MINKTLRRLAVGAAAITVAGVVVPLTMAQTASAATTTLSVTPTTVNSYIGGPVSFTVTPSAAATIQFDIYSGPDSIPATPLLGQACTPVGGGSLSYTCSYTAGAVPGTDHIHFYVGGTSYAPGDPSVDGTAVIAGPVNQVTITPTTSSQAQGVFQTYTVTATDSAGRPVPNANVTLTATQSNAASTNLIVNNNTTGKHNNSAKGTAAASPAGTNGTQNATGTTANGQAAQAAGTTTFNVESQVTGTVNVNVSGGAGIAANATLTVDPGSANDVTSVVLSPSSQKVFVGDTVTETATLKNAQGDVVGKIPLAGYVTGSNAGPLVSAGTTDGTGTATLTYVANNAGSDTVTGYVNQTNHGVNTGGLDSGEPSGTATVTVSAPLTAPVLTDSCPGGTCNGAASAASQTVTFTLKSTVGGKSVPAAGYNVAFANTGAATYTLSPLSAVTDANGQVTVTVSHTPNKVENGQVTATFTNGADPHGAYTDAPAVDFVGTAANAITLAPPSQTKAVGSTVTVTGKATNALGAGVSGDQITFTVTGRNNSTNNPGYSGTCTTGTDGTCTFSYTDKGAALTPPATGTDSITAVDSAGNSATGAGAAKVTYVAGTATASSVTLADSNVPSGFATTQPAGSTTPADTLSATVKDANGAPLDNDQVTFTLTGVGNFVDAKGNSLGTTVTVPTNNTGTTGVAVVGVTSKTPGSQTVTASADGVSSTPLTVTYTNSAYNPVPPQRLVDTRSGQGGITPSGPLAPNTNKTFCVGTAGFSYTIADAYVFNVTAIAPSGAGNLRIGPNTGTPATSLINYVAGQTSANGVVVPNTGGGGCFTLYSDGASANVAVDITGFYTNSGGAFSKVTPTRVADTRTGDGGAVTAGTTRAFQVAPASATNTAIALNVTAIAPTDRGFLEVYPDGATRPTASNINYVPGQTKAAFVVVQLPANGKIDVYSSTGTVNVAIDVFGTYTATTPVSLVTQAPARIYDTRSGAGELENNVPRSIQVTGQGGVPANAQAVLVSVTAIPAADSTNIGNLRVYPTGQALPTVSTVNYIGMSYPVANFAIVPIGAGGKIDLYSNGSNMNAAVDVLGYVPATS